MDAVRRDRLHLAQLEEAAAAIAERAGRLLMKRFHEAVTLEYKDDKQSDPVTETDRAVERLVVDELRLAFPAHGVLGEEGASEASDAEYVWVLDPLDGTANFAGRLPFFGLSLGLLRHGVPVVGCLFVPFGPHLEPGVLRGSRGNGASVGGERLRLDGRPLQPGGPAALPPGFNWAFKLKGELAKRPGELRNLGSICFELAMVAGGGFRYAAFVRPRVWDVAAGALLVREAGGLALTWEDRSWRPLERFVPPTPASRDAKPTTLRDWARPVLVGEASTVERIAPDFRLRPPPPRAIRWLLAGNRALRRWWRKRRQPPRHEGANG